MKKYILLSLLLLVGFLLVAIVLSKVSNSRTFQFFGEICPRVETSQKVIALTFDDGPTKEHIDEILKILADENIKATFFVIGKDIEQNPGQLEKIIAAGHEVGNHTYSHERMTTVSSSFVKDEIEKTDTLIRDAGYKETIHFRPPYGKKLFSLPYYLWQHDRKTITWDVEPETFVLRANDIINYTITHTKNGSIILLHVFYDSRKESMKAVQPIIKGLKEKGFEFRTVSDLQKLKGS